MREKSKDLFTSAAFSKDQNWNVRAGDQRCLLLQFPHAFARADKRVILREWNLLGRIVGWTSIVNRKMLFNGDFDITGEKRLHDDAAHAQSYHRFKVLQLGRA